MPKPFEDCVKKGGKVRTITSENRKFGLKKDEYMRVCFLNGKMYRGEIRKHGESKKGIN
ncbi:MAG: hypothetical protein N2Z85_02065 [Patescibacteria group bacterium]|nr:hypothetical protein [Patescibacteria group bacterium]